MAYQTKQQQAVLRCLQPVSYTHLDVYKRQDQSDDDQQQRDHHQKYVAQVTAQPDGQHQRPPSRELPALQHKVQTPMFPLTLPAQALLKQHLKTVQISILLQKPNLHLQTPLMPPPKMVAPPPTNPRKVHGKSLLF